MWTASSKSVRKIVRLEDRPELVTVPETADVLRCSASTVREMLRRGELTALKVGRLVRIRRAELEQLVRGEPA